MQRKCMPCNSEPKKKSLKLLNSTIVFKSLLKKKKKAVKIKIYFKSFNVFFFQQRKAIFCFQCFFFFHLFRQLGEENGSEDNGNEGRG